MAIPIEEYMAKLPPAEVEAIDERAGELSEEEKIMEEIRATMKPPDELYAQAKGCPDPDRFAKDEHWDTSSYADPFRGYSGLDT